MKKNESDILIAEKKELLKKLKKIEKILGDEEDKDQQLQDKSELEKAKLALGKSLPIMKKLFKALDKLNLGVDEFDFYCNCYRLKGNGKYLTSRDDFSVYEYVILDKNVVDFIFLTDEIQVEKYIEYLGANDDNCALFSLTTFKRIHFEYVTKLEIKFPAKKIRKSLR